VIRAPAMPRTAGGPVLGVEENHGTFDVAGVDELRRATGLPAAWSELDPPRPGAGLRQQVGFPLDKFSVCGVCNCGGRGRPESSRRTFRGDRLCTDRSEPARRYKSR
jgi:hypothetical protein